jgi:HK97 family phage major capsid protein
MADLTGQARALAAAIDAKKAEAATAWAEFDGLRKSAVSEGVDFAANAEAFDKLDTASKQYDTVRDEIAALEGKRARLLEIAQSEGKSMDAPREERKARTFGSAFTQSEAYQQMKARAAMGDNMPLGTTDGVKVMDREQAKALVSVTLSSGTSALNGVPEEDRTSIIVAKPLAGLDFLNVIATATTDSDVVEWLEETTYTNAAAETAEFTDSPESSLAFTVRSSNVREIPHFIPVTRRALADAAFVESWINNRLIDGVRRRLQTQVLSGNGSGQNFQGIYGVSGIGSIDRSSTGLSMTDSLHRCITTIRTAAFVEPDFIGIHPEDWEAIRLVRGDALTTDGTNDVAGKVGYIYGDPAGNGPATLWGVPVIVHAAFTSGTPLVGRGADATLFVREGLSVAASDSHASYFTERKVAILATMRAAFAVTQPLAFAKSVA